ncbi:sel1 repeat family protein [Sphingomonas sp. UV9]|uniref:tetratricopeptide repeat protein n=1 Tax=Sphingomonas sp. UV9 TaxID=1851410 RepID=UPI000FFB63D6|nr:tetratricopeptide repeat protein [Sphingomonas sp. UV9]RXD02425.1 sel1 repeat family protein [Sphingomonas sp. UV9]
MTAIDTLSPDAIAARLSGSPAERAAFVREAADAGVAEAQAVYGQMLLDGTGVAADPVAALGWFTRAAAQHHVMALNMVGRCYDLGWGTRVDKTRAAECYRVAAARGLDWAMYNYATLLALGDGVAEDKPAALALLETVAAMDTGLASAKAINFVGSFAEDGWACERDLARAADCYRQAAEGGDFRGCFNHARMLGAASDIEAALHWLKQAGERGNAAFLAKAEAWLATSEIPAFRTRGVAALREGVAC